MANLLTRWLVVTGLAAASCLSGGCSKPEGATPPAPSASRAPLPTESMAQMQFAQALMNIQLGTPERLLETCGDVPVVEVFHKVSGDEFYEVSYPLRGPQTATFLISKPPFAKDEFVWSGVDFKDGIHFENGERRLSDLLASTREERHAARARRERAAAAKESADRAASERRETAEREERMARDRADAEAGRKAALDDAASGREGKRSEVLDGIAQLRRDLAATDAEFTRTRERFDAEKRDLTAHWDQVLADEIARNREFQLKGVTDTEERRRVEEQLKVDDETSRTSIKQRLDEVLGDLATRRVRSVPPLERKSADLKAALGAAEAAQAAKLEEIERSYATECQSVEASFKDRMAALGADTLR